MRRSVVLMASICLLAAQACGDDDEQTADAGAGSGGKGAGGKGEKAGGGGHGGSGGAKAASGGSGGSGPSVQAVTIRFKAKLGDEDLDCEKHYSGQGATKLAASPHDFRFFVEQVRLIASGGEEVPVQFDERAPFQTKDVALIDFTERKGSCTAGGATVNTTITGKVPAGVYAGVVFVNGVPESLNHQNLTSAKPPLQDASTYWGWSSGYRFLMASVLADTGDAAAADGGSTSSGLNLVHVGAAGCSDVGTDFTCSRPNRNRIHLKGFDPDRDTIVADLSKVFADIDLRESVDCHGPGPECGPAYAALGVSLDTGAPLDVETVFRVE
jgi:uncharacterized repeat protein (TIGR04052 family)